MLDLKNDKLQNSGRQCMAMSSIVEVVGIKDDFEQEFED